MVRGEDMAKRFDGFSWIECDIMASRLSVFRDSYLGLERAGVSEWGRAELGCAGAGEDF